MKFSVVGFMAAISVCATGVRPCSDFSIWQGMSFYMSFSISILANELRIILIYNVIVSVELYILYMMIYTQI